MGLQFSPWQPDRADLYLFAIPVPEINRGDGREAADGVISHFGAETFLIRRRYQHQPTLTDGPGAARKIQQVPVILPSPDLRLLAPRIDPFKTAV